MQPVPLFPIPKLVERPWGGEALRSWNRNVPVGGHIGESWELGAVADCDSVLENGPFGTLSEAAAYDHGRWLGMDSDSFPLLVKLIDARETLSVQVHPSSDGPGYRSKNECWLVLEAPEGAELIAGTAKELPPSEIVQRLNNGDLSVLSKIPVREGDLVVIPAGTIHAITAGLLIAEIQQSSDTTYRVYDWGRVGLDGKARQLHLAESEACLNPMPAPGLMPKPVALNAQRELLCATPWFSLARIHAGQGYSFQPGDKFRILQVLEGPVQLRWPQGSRTLVKGQTVLLPAHCDVSIQGGNVLEAWVGDFENDIVRPMSALGLDRQAALALTAGTIQ